MTVRARSVLVLLIVVTAVGVVGTVGPLASPAVPAGCDPGRPAVLHHAGGKPVTSRGYRHIPIPCALPTGFPAFESTIGVTRSGTVFYSPTVDFTNPLASIGVARSADGGTTWQRVVPMIAGAAPFHFPADPYVYVDPTTSRVFFDTLHQPLQCGSDLSWSDDDGATWSHSFIGCPLFDDQKLFAGPPRTSHPVGYPNVVYYCAAFPVVTQGPGVGCMRSLDGGRTFSFRGFPYSTVEDGRRQCEGLTGDGTVGPDGSVYLAKGLCGEPYVAISRDEGATWSRVKVAQGLGIVGHVSDVGVDPAGNVYFSWVAATNRLPYLAVSRDGGRHWGRPMMIAPRGVREASLAQLAVGGRGRVALAYLGSSNAPGPPFPAGCTPAPWLCLQQGGYREVTFDGYVTQTTNALDADPLFMTAAINDHRDPIWRGCSPPGCNVLPATRVDYLGVDIGPDGTPWAALVDACTDGCVGGGTGASNTFITGLVGRLYGGPSLRR
ncbi:MAG TPA: sialidase family protein [Actinomycetota bacterium]|nr:sialidase family protein [Actinomycetota bacterium]